MALGSHAPAPALCLLPAAARGKWREGRGRQHTLMGGPPHMVPHSAVCALHLIAVALSWGAHSSHSPCAIFFTAAISTDEAGTVYRAISSSERRRRRAAQLASHTPSVPAPEDVVKFFYEFVKDFYL